MKLFVVSVLSAQALAFAPSTFVPRPSTKLFNSRVDSSDAVAAALEASKKFGPTSPEARSAWDIVEEMDASDNSAAHSGGVDEYECLARGDDPDPACAEYEDRIRALGELIEDRKAKIETVKTLAEEIRAVRIKGGGVGSSGGGTGEDTESGGGGSGGVRGADGPLMKKALKEAKDATEEFGIGSPEARTAWETVEEIASSDMSEATKPTLDEECLVETIEACEALDELNRVLNLQRNPSRFSG